MPLGRRLTLLGYAISTAFILVATLRPVGRSAFLGWSLCIICPAGGASEIVQNVLLFVPFGMALSAGRLRPGVALFMGFAFSLVVECAQMLIPGRDPNIGDLVFNTTGTALGWLVGAGMRELVLAPPGQAGRRALIAAGVTVAALMMVAWLLQPAYGSPPYRVQQWSSDRGAVLEAWLGDQPLHSGDLPGPAALALATRATLRVRAVLDTARRGPYWLRVHDGSRREIVSVRRVLSDVQVRYRTNAADLSLELTDSRARGVLARFAPGDTVDVRVSRDRLHHCADVAGTTTCGFGPTLASSWAVVQGVAYWPAGLLTAMNAAWLGLLFVPVGLSLRRERRAAAAAAAAFAGLWIVSLAFGLEAPRMLDVLGAAVGAGLAALLGAAIREQPETMWESGRRRRRRSRTPG